MHGFCSNNLYSASLSLTVLMLLLITFDTWDYYFESQPEDVLMRNIYWYDTKDYLLIQKIYWYKKHMLFCSLLNMKK